MKTHVRYLQEVKNGEGSKTDHLTMHSWVEVGRHYYTDDDLFKADDGKAGNYFSVFSWTFRLLSWSRVLRLLDSEDNVCCLVSIDHNVHILN